MSHGGHCNGFNIIDEDTVIAVAESGEPASLDSDDSDELTPTPGAAVDFDDLLAT